MRVYVCVCVYEYKTRRKKKEHSPSLKSSLYTTACVIRIIRTYIHIYTNYKLVCGFSRQEQQTVLTGWFFFSGNRLPNIKPYERLPLVRVEIHPRWTLHFVGLFDFFFLLLFIIFFFYVYIYIYCFFFLRVFVLYTRAHGTKPWR